MCSDSVLCCAIFYSTYSVDGGGKGGEGGFELNEGGWEEL